MRGLLGLMGAITKADRVVVDRNRVPGAGVTPGLIPAVTGRGAPEDIVGVQARVGEPRRQDCRCISDAANAAKPEMALKSKRARWLTAWTYPNDCFGFDLLWPTNRARNGRFRREAVIEQTQTLIGAPPNSTPLTSPLVRVGLGSSPAVPACQRRGRSTSRSGLPELDRADLKLRNLLAG